MHHWVLYILFSTKESFKKVKFTTACMRTHPHISNDLRDVMASANQVSSLLAREEKKGIDDDDDDIVRSIACLNSFYVVEKNNREWNRSTECVCVS